MTPENFFRELTHEIHDSAPLLFSSSNPAPQEVLYLAALSEKHLFKQGDVRFAASPCNVFVYEISGSEFCMSMFILLSDEWCKKFFSKKPYFPGKKAKTRLFCCLKFFY